MSIVYIRHTGAVTFFHFPTIKQIINSCRVCSSRSSSCCLPGGFPYPTLGDHQILPYLAEGRRLDKPTIVSQELYATMVRCWTENPEQRPTFTELVNLLEADESRNRAYVDITTLQTNISFPPMEQEEEFEGS